METAFKEWAVICRALAQGRQRVILRKGGIVEPGGAFRLEHREFLLMPTFLHQSPESIIPAARDLLADIDADRPPEGTVVFRHRARVTRSVRVTSLGELARFRPDHVWSDAVVAERFHRWSQSCLETVTAPGHCVRLVQRGGRCSVATCAAAGCTERITSHARHLSLESRAI